MASLTTIPLGTGAVVALSYQTAQLTGRTQAVSYVESFGPASLVQISYAPQGAECWADRTAKLLDYLANKVYNKTRGGLIDRIFATVARELSVCTQAVSLINSSDVRGNGTWTVTVRFEPITAVAGVARVDGSGNVLETYTVVSFDNQTVTLSGSQAPRRGDNLLISYTYLHKGLEFKVTEALAQLNILTSAGTFLDAWGQWFATPRLPTGTYGSEVYGAPAVYGTLGAEGDSQYSRRIIDKVLQPRDTKSAIIAAVNRVTGGGTYIVEWFEPSVDRGFVFRPTGTSPWMGSATGTDSAKHLIWGRTAKFLNAAVAGGGVCVFEVWVAAGSGYSTLQLQQIVNSYAAAGCKGLVRLQP